MPQERTEKSRYQSKSGANWVSPAQYLAEFVCKRMARKNGGELPDRFWQKPPWKKTFGYQVVLANRLLKTYSPHAVFRALRTDQGKRAYSLAAPFLTPLFEQEQKKWEREQTLEKVDPPRISQEEPRPTFAPKKNLLNRIRELDN